MASIDEKINERYLAKSPFMDKSRIKAKDLPLLKQLTDYFDSFGLQYEIRGSFQENESKGILRQYQDLDVTVRSNGTDNAYPVIQTLSRVAENMTEFKDTFPEFSKYMLPETKGSHKYVCLDIMNRFGLEDPKTSTKIDLCFEGLKVKPQFPQLLESYK